MKKAAAKPIAELVPGILSETLARRTGMTLDLIAGWDDIAGPDHAPTFVAEVRIKSLDAAQGRGASKRDAEQAAAGALLVREGVWKQDKK